MSVLVLEMGPGFAVKGGGKVGHVGGSIVDTPVVDIAAGPVFGGADQLIEGVSRVAVGDPV